VIGLLLAASLAASREPPVVLDPRLERFLAAPQQDRAADALILSGPSRGAGRSRLPSVIRMASRRRSRSSGAARVDW
jgi:hypothetical protein